MIPSKKLQIGLLLVICVAELIHASCLQYGHSCWGAHGKRSFNPQQQQQRNAPKPDDILASLRSFPDRDQLIQIRKFLAATRQIPSYNEIQKDLESSQSFGVGNSLDEENRNNNDFLENSDSEKMNARFRVKRSARKIFI